MIHQLIPGGLINLKGLREMKLESKAQAWRAEGRMKVHNRGGALWFEVDPIIEAIKGSKDNTTNKEAAR